MFAVKTDQAYPRLEWKMAYKCYEDGSYSLASITDQMGGYWIEVSDDKFCHAKEPADRPQSSHVLSITVFV